MTTIDMAPGSTEAELAKILGLSPLTLENLGSYLSSLCPKDRRAALRYAIHRIALGNRFAVDGAAPGGPVRPV